jgi:superfamily II DNA or RNA helicase
MVELDVNNVDTGVYASREVLDEIHELLSYEHPEASFIKSFYARQRKIAEKSGAPFPQWKIEWDGLIRFMKRRGDSGVFSTGLFPKVVMWLKANGHEWTMKDSRAVPEKLPGVEFLNEIQERDYQAEFNGLIQKRSRGVVVVGTGGGKSIMITQTCLTHSVSTLIITPNLDLKEQIAKTLIHFLGKGLVSRSFDGNAMIVVANIQSVAKMTVKELARFEMVIIDEFHHAAAKSYIELNAKLKNAYFRYGFTATPDRPDGRDMEVESILGNIIFRRSTSDLIEAGWLVPATIKIFEHKMENCSKLKYKAAYLAATQDPELLSKTCQIIRFLIKSNLQTLILVRFKDHGRILAEAIDEAVFLSGDDPVGFREEIREKFNDKKVKAIIATSVFGEGTDIPNIDALVNCRFQASEIQTRQGIGRGLRLADGAKNYEDSVRLGKSRALVFDFYVSGQKDLLKHSRERLADYKSERAFTVIKK